MRIPVIFCLCLAALGLAPQRAYSAEAAASDCRIGATKVVADFKPAAIIASERDVSLRNIERVHAQVEAFAKRAVPAMDKATACAAAREKAFLERWPIGRLREAVESAYRRYGVLPKDLEGYTDISPESSAGGLARAHLLTTTDFYKRPTLLVSVRTAIASLPNGWASYVRGARQGQMPAWVRTNVPVDARDTTGAYPDYLRYLDAALGHWNEVEDWMREEAWPRLMTIQGRKSWHFKKKLELGEELGRLRDLRERLVEEGKQASKEESYLREQIRSLEDRMGLEQDCIDGLNLATLRFTHRVQVAAMVPYLEPFRTPEGYVPPKLPEPPAAPKAVPISCMFSANPDIAGNLPSRKTAAAGRRDASVAPPATSPKPAEKKPAPPLDADRLTADDLATKICSDCIDLAADFLALKATYPGVKQRWLDLRERYAKLGGDPALDRMRRELKQLEAKLRVPLPPSDFNSMFSSLMQSYFENLKKFPQQVWRRHLLARDASYAHTIDELKAIVAYILYGHQPYDSWLAPTAGQAKWEDERERELLAKAAREQAALERQQRRDQASLVQQIAVVESLQQQIAAAETDVDRLEKEILKQRAALDQCLKRCRR